MSLKDWSCGMSTADIAQWEKNTKDEREGISQAQFQVKCRDLEIRIDSLEARFAWQDEMLERAKAELDRVVAYAVATEAEEKLARDWLTDLEKGP